MSVKYKGSNSNTLENLTINVREGEVVLIFGENGSGKSTLIKVLAGLLEYEGHVLFGGNELRDIQSGEFETLIGYMPQNIILFPGTVAENIATLEKPDSDKIIKVSKKLDCTISYFDYQMVMKHI